MAQEVAIILGFAVVAFIFFELWTAFREEHSNLGLFFFGLGMMMILVIVHTIMTIINNQAAYLGNYTLMVYQIVMWSFLGITSYIVFMSLISFVMTAANYAFVSVGWRAPFKKKPESVEFATLGGGK